MSGKNLIHIIKSFEMTEDEYRSHENDYNGYCINPDCRALCFSGCEGDMENGPCESCDENLVFGIPQLLIYGKIEIV